MIDDLLFLGTDYESAFDHFEVLLALEYAHINLKKHNHLWGPPGRFTWKYRNQGEYSPMHQIISQAEIQGNSWLPIKTGFFDGSIERFKEIAAKYTELVSNTGWL
jgi:hypothetical protein